MTLDLFPSHPPGWERAPDGIVFFKTAEASPRQSIYVGADGCRQASRSQNWQEAGYYDLPYYKRAIGNLLAHLPEEALIADLGCGDGRLVQILLEHGPHRVIAQDFNRTDLRRVIAEVGRTTPERLLPVLAPVTGQPLFPGSADGVILSEVAYTLPDPSEAYRHCHAWLKPGGFALISNVAAAAYYVHALFNGDMDNALLVAQRRQYREKLAGHDGGFTVSVYDETRMEREAISAGFVVEARIVVPAGPALALHAMRKAGADINGASFFLSDISAFGPMIPRLYIDLLRKS